MQRQLFFSHVLTVSLLLVLTLMASVSRAQERTASDELIRPATERDLPGIMAVDRDSFAADQTYERDDFLDCLKSKGCLLFVAAAEQGARIDGVVMIEFNARKKSGEIVSLAVLKEARGRKLGGTLLATAMQQLQSREIKTIQLEVDEANPVAIRLYERFGFQVAKTRKNYYGRGKSALIMTSTGCAAGQLEELLSNP